MKRSTIRPIFYPLQICSGPIEACRLRSRFDCRRYYPLQICSGPIEAVSSTRKTGSARFIRCKFAAAPLKLQGVLQAFARALLIRCKIAAAPRSYTAHGIKFSKWRRPQTTAGDSPATPARPVQKRPGSPVRVRRLPAVQSPWMNWSD